jgi:hypothetical protein
MPVPPITGPIIDESLPWYQYRWPWVLLAIPMSAVAFGIVMISTALLYPDDLVVDNYYKEGMAINRTLAMDAKAVDLGVTAVVEVDAIDMIALSLSGAADAVVTASLFHVTDRDKDQFVVLYPEMNSSKAPDPQHSADLSGPLPNAVQIYTGQSPSMVKSLSSPGIWYLELRGSEEPWRVRQRIQTPIITLEISPQ